MLVCFVVIWSIFIFSNTRVCFCFAPRSSNFRIFDQCLVMSSKTRIMQCIDWNLSSCIAGTFEFFNFHVTYTASIWLPFHQRTRMLLLSRSLAHSVTRFPTCSDPMSLSVRTNFVSSSYYSHLKCVYTSTENVHQSDWKHSNAEYCEWVGKPSIGYQNLMNCVLCLNYFHCTISRAPMKFHTIWKFCKCWTNRQNQCQLVVKLTMENTDRLPLLRLFPLQCTVRIEDTMFVHRLKAS